MDVAEWLRQISLEQYAELFAQQAISADVLPHLTAEDLKDAGIASVGDRRRLLVAIRALRAGAPDDALRASDLGSSAERRQITVLFCDIVDSTPLTTQLDPEELRELLSRYQLNVSAAVTATGGYVARVIGDGVLAYFGWPNADETHAESAVRASLAIIDTIKAQHLSIRVGVASGLVVIGDLMGAGAVQELMAVGETLHLASRLQALAEPDSVLVSESTHAQVSLLFEMEDLGRVTLKGFSEPQQVWRALRQTTLSGRSEALFTSAPAPIVGRTEELDFLLDQWRRTLAGDGRVVLLAGEPGIGKSRLLAALEERLANERHFSLRYFCSPYHQDDALHPIISRWERELGLTRSDSVRDKLHKLESLVASRGLAPDGLPLLAAMLSIPLGDRYQSLDLSAQRQKEKTFDVLIRRLADLAKMRPVLVLFEDAQWADPSTLELVEAGIDRLAGLPVLRIVSFRSDFIPPWSGRPNVKVLTLGRLDRQHSEMLAHQVAAQQILPPSLCERVIQQTDGVPLFIEEMTKAVLEESQSQPAAADSIVVPSTLQGSLMARLDRLPTAKEVAQISAVIGRNFSNALLAAIANLSELQLQQGLRELVTSNLAFQSGAGPDALYAFKHALVRDVAYESLPRNRRAELHAAIVRVIETDSSVGTIPPSRLGYHCAQAGLIAKAAYYYRAAGERSAERAGLAETRNHLERGLQFARSLPEGPDQQILEAELLIALGRLLIATRGQSDAEASDLFERAVAVCRQLNDPGMLARSLFALGAIDMSRGELQSVEAISLDLLALADTNRSSAIRIAGEVRLGILRFHQGRLGSALESLTRALELCREGKTEVPDLAITSSPDVAAAAYLANTFAHLGYAERAVAHAEQAIQRARPLGVASLAYSMALSTSARAYQTIGDEARCRSCAETLIAAAEEQGFPQYLALGQCLLGWSTARCGDITNGLSILSKALVILDSLRWHREVAYVNGLMADVLKWAGRWSDAIELLDATLLTSARSGVGAFDSALLRRKAVVLSTAPNADIAAAEQEFRHAIAIARSQSARLFELQACSGLARLMLLQGRAAQARDLLEPIYGWFSEGLGLPHLRGASEILARCDA
ncbi:MAG TPA: adenylate/guanylate cyclase domain-containing protein [Acetobacteraceae bacterium]|nr:adenylate/guanylate cyclase domain-containing protein [Acetobacteraceae bacterium]